MNVTIIPIASFGKIGYNVAYMMGKDGASEGFRSSGLVDTAGGECGFPSGWVCAFGHLASQKPGLGAVGCLVRDRPGADLRRYRLSGLLENHGPTHR